MSRKKKSTANLTNEELREMFQGRETECPPILSVEQAAKLANIPIKTLYDWSSRGLLDGCASRCGRRLRINRNRFVQFLFEN